MRVLVACEFSGIVRDAFLAKGHDAWSCDLLPTESPGPHIQGDVLKILNDGWDLMIAHPPCQYLSYAGVAHWNKPGRLEKRLQALHFFAELWLAPIEKICIENPKGCASPTISKYNQMIQPWFFGDKQNKPTWLWLKGLSLLSWDKDRAIKPQAVYYQMTGKQRGRRRYQIDSALGCSEDFFQVGDRYRNRSVFPKGIAKAMAEQWG